MIEREAWYKTALLSDMEREQERLYRDVEDGAITHEEFTREMLKIRNRLKGIPETPPEGLLKKVNDWGTKGLYITKEWRDAHAEDLKIISNYDLTDLFDGLKGIEPSYTRGFMEEFRGLFQNSRNPILRHLENVPGLDFMVLLRLTDAADKKLNVGATASITGFNGSSPSSVMAHSEAQLNQFVRLLADALREAREIVRKFAVDQLGAYP